MGRLAFSTRGLIVAVAVVGYDFAAMARAIHQGRLAHSVREYAIGFGSILLALNLIVAGLFLYYARRPRGGRLNSTPPPLVIFGMYLAVLGFGVLSVLFLTSGRF